MDPFKFLVLVLLFGIVGSLGSALIYLARDNNESRRTVRALTVRISLSVALFFVLLGAYALGLVQPHPLGG